MTIWMTDDGPKRLEELTKEELVDALKTMASMYEKCYKTFEELDRLFENVARKD